MLHRLARALRAPRTLRSRPGNPFGAEPLEPRRLLASVPATLPVTVSNLQWEVEGAQLGFSVDFLCEARPHEAYASLGDGTVKNFPMDYDPATGRGRVHGLYDYGLAGDHPVTVAVRRGEWIDAESFSARTDVAAAPAPDFDGSGSFTAASFDGGESLSSADGGETFSTGGSTGPNGLPPKVNAVYVSGSAWSQPFKTYLANHGLGHAAARRAGGAGRGLAMVEPLAATAGRLAGDTAVRLAGRAARRLARPRQPTGDRRRVGVAAAFAPPGQPIRLGTVAAADRRALRPAVHPAAAPPAHQTATGRPGRRAGAGESRSTRATEVIASPFPRPG